jgi:hypothetical protein
VESQERTVPAFSRWVGLCSADIGLCDVVRDKGEAWAIAIRHAMNRTVRGEGEGKGKDDGPTR